MAEALRGALYVVVGRADGSLVLVAWDESDAPEERYVVEKAHGAASSRGGLASPKQRRRHRSWVPS